MTKYSFNEKNEFIIENYDKAKTFASFLPGIAGLDGIPMWSFYVNRGQCMGSFGVKDKDNTIMEFFPANVMYKNIELQGFRTFIKINGEIHEIFSSLSKDKVHRRMIIEENILKIEEINHSLNIKITVTYFVIPKESFAGLARRVEFENLDKLEKRIEILDGLTQIIAFGVGNSEFQGITNLIKAWFDVYNIENSIPFYKVRATTSDSSQVGEVTKGNFYLSFSTESNGLIMPVVDMDIIFGSNTSLTCPEVLGGSLKDLYKKEQIFQNKISGGFTGVETLLKETFEICTIIGNVASVDKINCRKADFNFQYIASKEKEAREIIKVLVEDTFTKTSNHLFDKYIDQCYIDNILRGGTPLLFKSKEKNHVYHVYSRKHGDLEREYNFFSLEPAYYSQGNGNFRDVNQNRRNDVFFKPQVGDFNVKQFMSLIQADGYNPLSVKGSTFTFNFKFLEEILDLLTTGKEGLIELLGKKFTPGEIVTYLVDNKVEHKNSNKEILESILALSEQNFEAEFGEGYWTDHWTYNMDLIDTYVEVYPDKLEAFLFEENSYRFFDSAVRVLPREDKYVLAKGKVRQYDSIVEDEEKCNKLNIKFKDTNWLKTQNGKGDIYETNLYVKLISLALNKFISLDPYGMGIEMEANKPGWNDAMNGLPGIFGSSISEAAELKRILDFLLPVSSNFHKKIKMPLEFVDLFTEVEKKLDLYFQGNIKDFIYWDEVSTLKEAYRVEIRFGITGKEIEITTEEFLKVLKKFNNKLEKGLKKALSYGDGIYPTYITYEAKEYELIEGKFNPINGYRNVKITEFNCKPLPAFLEAPTRMLKIMKDKDGAKTLYEAIKKSSIYDEKLNMYKTSVSLAECTNEIGRARAFTEGWLERESIFLHMEYKYLLALLKAGLYEEFFNDMQTTIVPFLDPEVYGRSTLENSSFIASSVNPDKSLHGRGFVARLSGSTSEMLSIWFLMMAGAKTFKVEDEELRLSLNPILPGWLFKGTVHENSSEEGLVKFKFLGKVDVTYHNPSCKNTFGEDSVKTEKYLLVDKNNNHVEIKGSYIGEPYSKEIRIGEIKEIQVYLK